MKKYDVIIIGAGPAGIITGVTAKKQFPEKTVLMIKKEEKGLVPCGIPYIFHNLNSVEKNAMGPKPFIDLGGDVLTDSVIKVDIEEKKVEVKSGDVYSFEKLVFATGSESIVASFIKGHELENVFYIKKSYNYINNLFNEIKDKKNIVVVGGGFIGVEVAEQLSLHKDKKVSLVELEEYCFSKAFSDELSEIATKNLENTDIEVYTSTRVDEIFGDNGKVKGVKLSNGKVIDAEVVILAVGYKSETSLAKNANVQINECGAISVDNYGRTTNNDVFAVGDCSQTIGFMTGRSDMIMLASTATAEARVVGYNLFGVEIKNSFTGTIGIFSTKIANLSMAAAGLNEKNAVPANIDFISAKFSDVDKHPGTITGTMPLTVKLYVSPSDGTLLGGEVWGAESAGEIINTIGLAIQKSLTVYELISLQIGTHPLLTSAPTKPLFVKAAEVAFNKIKVLHK